MKHVNMKMLVGIFVCGSEIKENTSESMNYFERAFSSLHFIEIKTNKFKQLKFSFVGQEVSSTCLKRKTLCGFYVR